MYSGSSRKISRKLRGRWEYSVSGHQKLDRFAVRCERQCGDASGDGLIGPGDVVFLIDCLFRGGAASDPLWTGDCDCD